MKNVFLTAFLCSGLLSSCGDRDPGAGEGWERKANFPGSFYDAAPTFSIDEKGYIMRSRELWEYNAAANAWTQRTSLPYPSGDKDEAFAFSLNGMGYVGCGGGAVNSKDFWQYDSDDDSWTQLEDFPGKERYSASCFVVNGKAYVVSGENNSDGLPPLTDVWEYDAGTGWWTQKNDIPFPGRRSAVSFAAGGRGYVGTGYNPYLDDLIRSDFYEYDPAADTWSEKASFPAPEGRYTAIGFGIGKRGFAGTGFKNVGEGYNDFYEFEPGKNTWTRRADLGYTGRFAAVSFVIGNTGYVGGGVGADYDLVKDANGNDRPNEYLWAYTLR